MRAPRDRRLRPRAVAHPRRDRWRVQRARHARRPRRRRGGAGPPPPPAIPAGDAEQRSAVLRRAAADVRVARWTHTLLPDVAPGRPVLPRPDGARVLTARAFARCGWRPRLHAATAP